MKRSIKIRLGFVFLLIFVPFLVMMVNSFITFNTLSDDGKSINLSGSQRMRTMLLSNYSQQLYYARQANNDEESTSLEELLTKEVNTYNENMTTLISGDSSKGIKENKTQSIVDAINTITPDVTSYSTAVSDLISGNKEKENLDYIITQSLNIKNEINAVVGMYQERYDNKIKSFKNMLFVLLGVGIAFFGYGTYVSGKKVVQPILTITKSMQKIAEGEGDLTSHINLNSKDEIGQLANYFNVFIEHIRNIVVEIDRTSSVVSTAAKKLDVITDEAEVSADKMAVISNDIANGATEQAESSTITANGLVELGDEITQIHQLSSDMESLSKRTMDINNESKKSVETLSDRNSVSYEATDKIGKEIEALNVKAENIQQVTAVIGQIANQTNLLALNASIEAARAGEDGKGFAVVANEVGSLAEQSAKSTSEIESVVNEVIQAIKKVSELKENILNISKEQTASVEKTKHDFEIVNGALTELINKINTINQKTASLDLSKNKSTEAITNIAAVSEETAAATEEVAAFSDEFLVSMNEINHENKSLVELADSLKTIIGRFTY